MTDPVQNNVNRSSSPGVIFDDQQVASLQTTASELRKSGNTKQADKIDRLIENGLTQDKLSVMTDQLPAFLGPLAGLVSFGDRGAAEHYKTGKARKLSDKDQVVYYHDDEDTGEPKKATVSGKWLAEAYDGHVGEHERNVVSLKGEIKDLEGELNQAEQEKVNNPTSYAANKACYEDKEVVLTDKRAALATEEAALRDANKVWKTTIVGNQLRVVNGQLATVAARPLTGVSSFDAANGDAANAIQKGGALSMFGGGLGGMFGGAMVGNAAGAMGAGGMPNMGMSAGKVIGVTAMESAFPGFAHHVRSQMKSHVREARHFSMIGMINNRGMPIEYLLLAFQAHMAGIMEDKLRDKMEEAEIAEILKERMDRREKEARRIGAMFSPIPLVGGLIQGGIETVASKANQFEAAMNGGMRSTQMIMAEIQFTMQQWKIMTEMTSNTLKSLHDMAMTPVRNIR